MVRKWPKKKPPAPPKPEREIDPFVPGRGFKDVFYTLDKNFKPVSLRVETSEAAIAAGMQVLGVVKAGRGNTVANVDFAAITSRPAKNFTQPRKVTDVLLGILPIDPQGSIEAVELSSHSSGSRVIRVDAKGLAFGSRSHRKHSLERLGDKQTFVIADVVVSAGGQGTLQLTDLRPALLPNIE